MARSCVGVVGFLHQRELCGGDTDAAQAVVVELGHAPGHPVRAVGILTALLDRVDQSDHFDLTLLP